MCDAGPVAILQHGHVIFEPATRHVEANDLPHALALSSTALKKISKAPSFPARAGGMGKASGNLSSTHSTVPSNVAWLMTGSRAAPPSTSLIASAYLRRISKRRSVSTLRQLDFPLRQQQHRQAQLAAPRAEGVVEEPVEDLLLLQRRERRSLPVEVARSEDDEVVAAAELH